MPTLLGDQTLKKGNISFMSDFNVEDFIEGYTQGYFLMADSDEAGLGWYSSNKRALIPLDERFRYPKSLQRVLNQNRFQVAIDRDFQAVVEGCSGESVVPEDYRPSTWISPPLKEIYYQLHAAGYAHSFETWQGDELAGGILGIVINGIFIGESMFYRIPEGSKVAMVKLVEHLRRQKFILFDAQMNNPHLERFGSFIISDRSYQILLKEAIAQPPSKNFVELEF